MKSITIADFKLSKPEERDYNWNSEFKQTFGSDPNIYLVTFEIPSDYFWPDFPKFSIRRSEYITDVFIEFNKLFKGKTTFQTIIKLTDDQISSFDFFYSPKQDRIDELQSQVDTLVDQINELKKSAVG